MVAARGLCSESGSSGDDSDGGSIGDAAEEEVLFPDDVDAPAPSLPPPPVSPPLPHPNLAGYVYIDPADPRTCFGRLTKFRGQQAGHAMLRASGVLMDPPVFVDIIV